MTHSSTSPTGGRSNCNALPLIPPHGSPSSPSTMPCYPPCLVTHQASLLSWALTTARLWLRPHHCIPLAPLPWPSCMATHLPYTALHLNSSAPHLNSAAPHLNRHLTSIALHPTTISSAPHLNCVALYHNCVASHFGCIHRTSPPWPSPCA